MRRPRPVLEGRRGRGRRRTVAYRGAIDEIDLDATLERLRERPIPEDADIRVRDRLHTERSVMLLVDVSGSMRGERIATAAATVGALAGELTDDALAVVAFWSDAAVLLELGEPIRPAEVLDRLLRIPAQGLTNISFPLEIAASRLRRVPSPRARAILLSDCVHNAGPDPRLAAAGLPRLDVLLDATGEHDTELGRALARGGRGRCQVVRSYRDVAPALTSLFGADR